MKNLITYALIYSLGHNVFAMGDPGGLRNPTRNMKDATTTLNQVTDEKETKRLSQQDLQEKIYQEQQAREEQEWELQKKHSDLIHSGEISNE